MTAHDHVAMRHFTGLAGARRAIPFILAGAFGFATDAAVLVLLTVLLGLDPFIARVLSVAAAIAVTWTINRTLTFGPSGRPLAAEGARYGAVAVAVGFFNYIAYAGLLLAVPAMRPLVALIIAAAFATLLSWLGYSRLIFSRGARNARPERSGRVRS